MQINNNAQVKTAVFLTHRHSKSRTLVHTLPKKEPIVDANNIDHAAFHFDSSGISSVSKGSVCASTITGKKNRRNAHRNNAKI